MDHSRSQPINQRGRLNFPQKGPPAGALPTARLILLRICISIPFSSVVQNIQLLRQLTVCRLPTASDSGQLNSSCVVVQQNQDASHARDADILNMFLAKGPTPVPTAPPKCVPGKPTAAVMPAQHISGYVGGASAWTPANAQKETPMLPSPCQAKGLGNLQMPAQPPAGTSLRFDAGVFCFACSSTAICKHQLSHLSTGTAACTSSSLADAIASPAPRSCELAMMTGKPPGGCRTRLSHC